MCTRCDKHTFQIQSQSAHFCTVIIRSEKKFSSLLFLVVLHCCLSGYMYILALGSDSRTSWVNDPLLGGIDPRRCSGLDAVSYVTELCSSIDKPKSDSIPVERTHPVCHTPEMFPASPPWVTWFCLTLVNELSHSDKSHCPPSPMTEHSLSYSPLWVE